MGKKLTVKERKLVKAKAEGKTHLEAAKEANYLPNANENTIQVEVARTLNKPHVKQAMAELMDEEGIGDKDLLRTLKEGLQASKTIVMGKDEDSFVDIQPDHATRHKFLETGLRLRGHGAKAEQGGTIIFNNGDVVQKYVTED